MSIVSLPFTSFLFCAFDSDTLFRYGENRLRKCVTDAQNLGRTLLFVKLFNE